MHAQIQHAQRELSRLRAALQAEIARSIDLLDALDGDPDLEPDADGEPDGSDELSAQLEIRGGALVAA